MSQVRVTPGSVLIDQVECTDPGAVSFFADTPEPSRPELVCRALAVGVIGLRAMGAVGHVELVEREFGKLSDRFGAALAAVEASLLERVRATFDPGQAESVSARLAASVAETHQAATVTIEQARSERARLITDSFNPDLATSCVYRIAKLTADTRAELDQAFDPAYENSHLAKLAVLVDSYFGQNGSLAGLVADQVNLIKEELLKALQGVRELIAGQAAAAGERDRSPASGLDFEDEVDGVLRRMATAYGDTVEWVGTQPGDSGRSKLGDFVVQLPDGCRFVVEAKKRSAPLPLRGDRGLLAILQGSMVTGPPASRSRSPRTVRRSRRRSGLSTSTTATRWYASSARRANCWRSPTGGRAPFCWRGPGETRAPMTPWSVRPSRRPAARRENSAGLRRRPRRSLRTPTTSAAYLRCSSVGSPPR